MHVHLILGLKGKGEKRLPRMLFVFTNSLLSLWHLHAQISSSCITVWTWWGRINHVSTSRDMHVKVSHIPRFLWYISKGLVSWYALLAGCVTISNQLNPWPHSLGMCSHWLPVQYRIRLKILTLIFRPIHGLAPEYISNLISVKDVSKYSLGSNDGLLLNQPSARLRKTLRDTDL